MDKNSPKAKEKRRRKIRIAAVILAAAALLLFANRRHFRKYPEFPELSRVEQIAKIMTAQEYDKYYTEADWAFLNVGQSIPGVGEASTGVDINLYESWRITRGEGAVVGIVDYAVGVYGRFGDDFLNLKENVLVNDKEIPDNGIDDDNNGYVDDYYGWNFIKGDNTALIPDYAKDNQTAAYISMSTIARVAPKAKFVLAAIKDDDVNVLKMDDIGQRYADAIQYVIDRGATIVCMAVGVSNGTREMKRVIKDNPDVLFVTSVSDMTPWKTGNVTYLPDGFSCKNIMRVLPIDMTGKRTRYVGLIDPPDIAAPGIKVRMLKNADSWTSVDSDQYGVHAALTAGAAALIQSHYPNMTGMEIKKLITDNATQTKALFGSCKARGYLNIYACLTAK